MVAGPEILDIQELYRRAREEAGGELTYEQFIRQLQAGAARREFRETERPPVPQVSPDTLLQQKQLERLRARPTEPQRGPQTEEGRAAEALRRLRQGQEMAQAGLTAVRRTTEAIQAVGAAQREREVIAGPGVTPTPTPAEPRGVPLAQLPLTAPERAAVERGELGGPPSGPSIVELGLWTPIVAGLAVAAPALAIKFPVLAAFLVEQQAEQAGIIPGRPVGRAIEFLAEPGKQNLEDLGVPEGAASIISELTLFGAIGKAPAGQRTLPELMAAARQLSKEDVAKVVRATENIVVRGEAGTVRVPGEPPLEPVLPKVVSLDEKIASGEAMQVDVPRRIAEVGRKIPGVSGGINAVAGPSATARGNPVAEAWVAWRALLDNWDAATKVGMSKLRALGRPLEVGKGGIVKNVRKAFPDAWTGPREGHIYDVVQWWDVAFTGTGPNAAKANRQLRLGWQLLDEAVARYQAAGGAVRQLGLEKVGAHYWPREVFSKDGIKLLRTAARGGGLGGKPRAVTRHRMWEWAEQGARNGVDYGRDYLAAIETTVGAINRATLDLQLAQNVSRRGLTGLQLVSSELKATSASAGQSYTWADRVLRYVRASVRGRPAAPALRTTRVYGEPPAELREIIDGVKAANRLKGVARRSAIAEAGDRAQTIRDQALRSWNDAKAAVRTRREAMARTEVLPGAYFGRPEEAIRVGGVGGRVPGLGGRVFTAEDVDFIIKHWGDIPVGPLRGVSQAAGVVRFGQTAVDPGFWFIQGLLPLGRDVFNLATGRPTAIWAKSVYRSLEALGTPNGLQRYIAMRARQDPAKMERFARYVGGISTSEYTEAAREGGLLMRIPLVRPVAKKAAQFFDGYMNAAQVETWWSLERLAGGDPRKLEQLGAYVRNRVGMLSANRIGLTPTQQMVEAGFVLYAPRYRRAGVALTLDALRAFVEPGSLRARQSLQDLAGLAAAGSLAYIGAAKATGMTDEEIIEGLKPWSGGRFMSIRVGGRWVGIGGVQRSLLNMVGRLGRASIEEPSDFLAWAPEQWNDNPLFRVARSQASPGGSIPYDILSGETFLGEPTRDDWGDLSNLGLEFVPFWLEAGLSEGGSLQDRMVAAGAEFAGLRAYPVSPWQEIDFKIDGMGFENSLGEPLSTYRDLTLPQKLEAEDREPEIANLLMAGRKRGRGVYAEITELNEERTRRLEAAAFDLEAAGPSQEALRRYADSVKNTRSDIAEATTRTYERAGVTPSETENPDLQLYFDYIEWVGQAVAPDELIEGERYGELDQEFRAIIGPEQAADVLDPQLMADRDPPLQQWERWNLAFGDSGYYELENADGTPDSPARLRFRERNPEFDAMGYLLGRFGSVRTRAAQRLVETWFAKWLAGEKIPLP